MINQKLLLVIGSVCVLLLVVGYIGVNLTANNTGNSDDLTTDDNLDTPTGNNTEPETQEPTTNDTPVNNDDNTTSDNTGNSSTTNTQTPSVDTPTTSNVGDHEGAQDYVWDASDVVTISLNTNSISADTEQSIVIDKTTLTITSAGTYSISGTLNDGQIVVDTNDQDVVRLILNGVNIKSSINAPILVEDAEKTVIILADNTENFLADSKNNPDNGTIASTDNLTIYGDGALTVTGNTNDGIRSNDGLIIKSGTITVTSVDDGIRGKDYLVIEGGNITINSVGDGLTSDNTAEASKGYIYIEDSTINVTSTEGDAITAQTNLLVTSGTFTLTSGGGSSATLNANVSTKGLKSGVSTTLDSGTFVISSSDDAIHSNGAVTINGGQFELSSGDEAVFAETLEINDATIVVSKSSDGIKGVNVEINDTTIEVNSNDDGITANDILAIVRADVTVNSVGDGIKSDNEEDSTKGLISIEACTVTVVSSQGDAITAQTQLLITSGTFTLTSGGGSVGVPSSTVSTKGLKAGSSIIVDAGDFVIRSSDDTINSNNIVTINGGTFELSTRDDAIHANNAIEINGGTIKILQSYEGIESANVTINDGYVKIVSNDDAINLAGTTTGTQTGFTTFTWFNPRQGGGGGGGFEQAGDYYLYINGGTIVINSGGDGIDSNGYVEMTNGLLIIDGPTSNMNAAIDYGGGSFTLTGGTVIAAGSSGMAQGPSASSTQYSVIITLNSTQQANTIVNIQTSSGEDILTFCPSKSYQSLVFSSAELSTGTYDIYLGGSSTGTLSNGIYENGTYSGGTLFTSFTISNTITTVGGRRWFP